MAPQLQASPVPPGFIAGTMPGMPFPGMLPMPPMLPPGVAGGAGMPSFVPPPFAAGMAGMPPMMQQVPTRNMSPVSVTSGGLLAILTTL